MKAKSWLINWLMPRRLGRSHAEGICGALDQSRPPTTSFPVPSLDGGGILRQHGRRGIWFGIAHETPSADDATARPSDTRSNTANLWNCSQSMQLTYQELTDLYWSKTLI